MSATTTPSAAATPAVPATASTETPVQAAPLNRGRRSSNDNYMLDATIVAKPLTSVGDLFVGIRPKNPNVTFRGVTFKVSTRDGESSLRYEQARSQGFRNVTVNDVLGTVPPAFVRDNGQRIVCGDCILMMIDKNEYRSALKWKDEQALRGVRKFREATLEQGRGELERAMNEINASPKLTRKLKPFAPTGEELSRDFGDEG
jgi:hypothetical protein